MHFTWIQMLRTRDVCERSVRNMAKENLSHLPSHISAKERATQYPDILHESMHESGGKLFCVDRVTA